jgi:hypothetical protein
MVKKIVYLYIKGIHTVIMIKTRLVRWAWNVASRGMRTRRMYVEFGRKAERKREFERPRRS